MLLLALLLAATGAGEPAARDVDAYLELATAYERAGSPVVESIRAWTGSEIADAQRGLRSREGQLRDLASSPGDVDLRLVEAAALLHLEAGIKALQETDEATGRIQLSAAGELVRWTAAAAARRSKDPATPPDRQLHPRLGWAALHATTSAAALAVGFPVIARAHGEEARAAAPTDAAALLALATALDSVAHLQAVEGRTTDARATRQRATAAFEDVLAVTPKAAEARLRLGRLLEEDGRLVEAEPLLERAVRDGDPRQRYLAQLFLARIAERKKDWRAAFQAYSRALEAVPDGSAARLGLALQRERMAGTAAEALSRSARLDARADPWSNYPFGDVDSTARDLKRLWDEVLGP
jgi:tetratricopeptide (TPR) repeat protein